MNNPQNPDRKLQQEFNRWAQEGEGEKMEGHHLDITLKTIASWTCVLTTGCLTLVADQVGPRGCSRGRRQKGRGRQVDVSSPRWFAGGEASKAQGNVKFVQGSAQKIPSPDNSFDKMLSVESFYYYADQDAAPRRESFG